MDKQFQTTKAAIIEYLKDNQDNLDLSDDDINNCTFSVEYDSGNNKCIGICPEIYGKLDKKKIKEFNYMIRQ